MSGVVSSVQLTVGEKTTDTAAFLLADTSGGLRFTTQVSREDAVYVDSGDTVALKAGDRTWEDMTVLSTETEEDHTVKVTVYVPKKQFPWGQMQVWSCVKLRKNILSRCQSPPYTAKKTNILYTRWKKRIRCLEERMWQRKQM